MAVIRVKKHFYQNKNHIYSHFLCGMEGIWILFCSVHVSIEVRRKNGRDFLWKKIKLLFIADVSSTQGWVYIAFLFVWLFACLLLLILAGLFTHMEGRKYNNGGRRMMIWNEMKRMGFGQRVCVFFLQTI